MEHVRHVKLELKSQIIFAADVKRSSVDPEKSSYKTVLVTHVRLILNLKEQLADMILADTIRE